MTNPYQLYATNKKLEAEKGIVLDYPGFSITIARAGGSNKKFNKTMLELVRPYRRQQEQGLLDEELANELLIKAYAEAVILGWEGIDDENGEPLEYSKEACIKLLSDLPELFNDIQKQAQDYSNFKVIQEEIERKN
jgi:hypothetical protein